MSFLNPNPYWLVVDRRESVIKILPCRYTPTSSIDDKSKEVNHHIIYNIQ